ncbi:MAG: sulfite exporter TauE/SafE family protein [Spirochaetaceae bacterium]|nr:sulfite exporter TauE/SafE family protein [Spirochaetaceae bacterium]
MALTILLVLLGVFGGVFAFIFFKDFFANKKNLGSGSYVKSGALGFVTNFFDALGIGSFAPTTAGLKLMKQTEDRLIPGTLNVACTLPVVFMAFVFIRAVEVDPVTLITMIASATLGAFLGAGVVAKMPAQTIRLIIGIALAFAAFLMLAGLMGWMPGGGLTTGLTGWRLVVGILGNFVLGALMTAGVGLYAPCMALVYLLGMSPAVAFPIMMGSCAFLMPVASMRFVKAGTYARIPAIAITLAGIVGAFIAASFVSGLPLNPLRWLVIGVLIYTSVTLIVTFLRARKNA